VQDGILETDTIKITQIDESQSQQITDQIIAQIEDKKPED
jgi:hypothetical protein